MPCFKGLAVSIHTPDGPISEYSIQRQSRASRIGCFIPVPPPKVPQSGSAKAEQSTFAISITLLNPEQDVPYSTPKPTADCPSPKPKKVGKLAGEPGQIAGAVAPYQGLTKSPNETVAAYIYFDGRQKEEVATLLRRGEETWVNSRWVSVPDSEGGGIAEREFLFREVGLERWLNGLDLEGKDAAAKIERRRQKIEKRRVKREEEQTAMEMEDSHPARSKSIMRYGNDEKSPLEDVSDDDLSSDSDDDDPIPETAGQIKVALFRVLASGEIKRGEYSPQFDAHDDEEGAQENNGGGDADVDHTTSFAKPKTLDPKTISTQTVTGIDPSDKPYAIFTFMYRGERQLQKMGILKDTKAQETPGHTKRKSIHDDLANLGPIKPGGAVGFLNFRDNEPKPRKGKKSDDDMDSDDDDTDNPILGKADDEEAKDDDRFLSPDDIKRQGELAESMRKIRLKRQHSAEPPGGSVGDSTDTPASGSGSTPPANERSTTPPKVTASTSGPEPPQPTADLSDAFGSPLKKQRASVSTADENALRRRIAESSGRINEVLGSSAPESTPSSSTFGIDLNLTPELSAGPPPNDEEL